MLQKIKKKIFSISAPPCEKKDEYYFSVGRLYGISGIILLICVSIFVLASIVFGYRELTHENIYFFINRKTSLKPLHSRGLAGVGFQ